MVLRDGLTLVGFGAIGGLALTLAGGRLVEGFLYNLKPSDPVALGVATLLLVITAALAGYLPARRAARVDPMVALRTE
jgi:putative ABC transport system permease protein